MYAVKRETEEILCHGCLSANRKLSPLTNYEMYFCVLGNKQTLEEYKYLNILLCWECQALLRRTQEFRNTLQRAQYLLSVAHTEQVSPKSLSTLSYKHKPDFDYIIEESIESKNEEVIIDNSETLVKEEIEDFEPDNIEYSDIKEENEIQLFQNQRKYRKKDTEKREFKKIDSGLDLNHPEKYFNEICLSEKEVDEILEQERRGDARRPHKCGGCGFWFFSRTDAYEHKKTMHRQRTKPGKCPDCAHPYKSFWELELHCWRSHAAHRCSLCERVVAHRERVTHLRKHRFRYRCLKCGFDFENKQLYERHEKELHSKYTCGHCDRTLTTKKALEKHVIRHHLPATCSYCNLSFTTWERLRRHARDTHERTGPAYCVECDRTFINTAKYRRHLSQSQLHRPKQKLSIPCPECGKVFSRTNYMNNHMKLFHSNQSRHHCPLCDKYFVNGWGLRQHHKFVHEKMSLPKTKICSVCGRGFGTNRVLENHMRTHTGERPFSCAHCPAAFAQRVALKAHLAAIHKEK
ncbi:zinc finger protein 729-like [Leguminivora glycinivorella]|uniref:zinc finger protein 729-like n=1 Tax=Leguminivora glycinivorella TaxID=1035111 RepID=UPI00200BC6BF|nr:zinc finger protein 729-like [Leguminivora glycinivorella]